MTYCDADDLRLAYDDDVLVQLTDDADTGAIIESVLTDACVSVTGEIDGYLRRRYVLPLSETVQTLRSYALSMSLYRLYCRKQGPPDWVVKLYDDAIIYLRLVAGGQADIDAELSASAPDISMYNPERIFTRETMVGF